MKLKSAIPKSNWKALLALWIVAVPFAICLGGGGIWVYSLFKYGERVARLNAGTGREVIVYTPTWNEVNRVYYVRVFEQGSEADEGARFLGGGGIDDNLSDKKFVVHRSRDGETIAISCANTPADILMIYDFRMRRFLDFMDQADESGFAAGLRRVQENTEGMTLRESPDGTI